MADPSPSNESSSYEAEVATRKQWEDVDPTHLAGRRMSPKLRRIWFGYFGALAVATIVVIVVQYRQFAERTKPEPVVRRPIVAASEESEGSGEH